MHSAKTERDLLIERLLLEHKERQQRQQRQPERPPVRTAWEDDLDRNERQLEQELGLPHLQPHKASCEDAEAASVSDVSPPRYPEAYLDGELAPGEETLEGERPLMGSDELLGFDDGLGADVDGSLAPDPRLAPSSPLQASSCAVAAEASTPGPREPRAVGPPEGSSRTPASGAAQGRRPEAEQPAAPTFQPQINPRSAALASTRPGDCYSRLASQRAEEFAKREERRMAVEKDRLAECTFTPRLKAKPKPGGSGRGSGGRGSVGGRRGGGSGGSGAPRGVDAQQAAGERLHHDAEVRTELRERRALSSEAWEAASFPFAPHINERPAGAALPTRPLHERLEDEVAKREAKLAQLRQKHAESEATFQPHIDPNSAAISLAAAQPLLPADARGGGGFGGASAGLLGSGVGRGDIVERLTAEGAVSLERRAAREAAVRAAEEQSCPFHPRLNALSEQIMSEGGGEGHDVFARQARHLHNIEEKRQRREEEQQQQQRRLFKPVISDASAILLQARPERLNETPADKTERLAYLDAQRREGVRQQLQQQQAQECTFRPQIDAISARLARSKTRDELSANSRGKAKKAQIAEAIEREALAECTFQPKMHARSGVLAEQVGARAPLRGEAAHELTRRIEVQQAEREARLERCRREAENEKLKECTFQPKIHTKATPETGSPVVVRGLGRYVELKEMAKRQAEAQKQREQKAFLTEPPARLQPYTVPEPFKLSKPRLDERAAARLRELADYEMQECTFAPKTNEVSSTQLLARVMQRAS